MEQTKNPVEDKFANASHSQLFIAFLLYKKWCLSSNKPHHLPFGAKITRRVSPEAPLRR